MKSKWKSLVISILGIFSLLATVTLAQDVSSLEIGKPYNLNLVNKSRTDKFYCSQLVWRGYKNAGLDLGINTPFVAPKQLWNSKKFPQTIVNR